MTQHEEHEDRREYSQWHRQALQLIHSMPQSFLQLAEALSRIHHGELWRVGGYTGFDLYLEDLQDQALRRTEFRYHKRLRQSDISPIALHRSTAYRLITIYDIFQYKAAQFYNIGPIHDGVARIEWEEYLARLRAIGWSKLSMSAEFVKNLRDDEMALFFDWFFHPDFDGPNSISKRKTDRVRRKIKPLLNNLEELTYIQEIARVAAENSDVERVNKLSNEIFSMQDRIGQDIEATRNMAPPDTYLEAIMLHIYEWIFCRDAGFAAFYDILSSLESKDREPILVIPRSASSGWLYLRGNEIRLDCGNSIAASEDEGGQQVRT